MLTLYQVCKCIRSASLCREEKQAQLRESLAFDIASNWLTAVSDCDLPPPTTWLDKNLDISPAPKKIQLRRGRNKLISRVLNVRKVSEGTTFAA